MGLVLFGEIGDLEGSGRPGNMRDTHSLKRMPDFRELTVPDFRTLIADADASFLAHFRYPDIVRKMTPKIGHY